MIQFVLQLLKKEVSGWIHKRLLVQLEITLWDHEAQSQKKIHINLFGLGAATYVDNIRNKKILSNKVGLSSVPAYPYSFQINENS